MTRINTDDSPDTQVHIDEGGAVQWIAYNAEIVLRILYPDDLFLLLSCNRAGKSRLLKTFNKHAVGELVKRHLLFPIYVPGLFTGRWISGCTKESFFHNQRLFPQK